MTKSAAERAAISRQNGQKSHGPKTPAGKDRSRFNAVKHGLKAKVLVLPGEDAQEFQGRLDAWIADWQPTNDVEQSLVERAVTLTWQLDRAERAETARLAALILSAPAEEVRRQEDEARALGQRLFFDRRGPVPLYPHDCYSFPNRPRTSCSGLSDDPDDPPRLLLRLEATAAGCLWLLDRWGELGALLDRGLSWQSPDTLRAIRLLGHQPLDAADSEVVATIFQACHVLDPQAHHQARIASDEAAAGELDGDEKAEARSAWQRCGAAFTELLGELTAEEGDEYRRRLEGRRVDALRPRNPAVARATLRAIVEKAVIRLEAKREVHAAHAALVAAAAADRLGFDDSVEGERLRRFQLAGQRALLRTVDSLMKLRRQEPPGPTVGDPAEPAGTGALGDGLNAMIWCGPAGIDSSFGADVLLAGPNLLAGPFPVLEPEHDLQNLPNEPTAAVDNLRIAAEESPAALGEHRIGPNEPTDPAGDHPIVSDEPTIPAADRSPQQGAAQSRRSDSPSPEAAHAIRKAIAAVTNPAVTPARGAYPAQLGDPKMRALREEVTEAEFPCRSRSQKPPGACG